MFPLPSLPLLTARSVVELMPCSWDAAQGTVLGCVMPRILWPLIRTESKQVPCAPGRSSCLFLQGSWLWKGRTGCKFDPSPAAGGWMLGHTWMPGGVPRPCLIMEHFLHWTWLRAFHYHTNRAHGSLVFHLPPPLTQGVRSAGLIHPRARGLRTPVLKEEPEHEQKPKQIPGAIGFHHISEIPGWLKVLVGPHLWPEILWPWSLHVPEGKADVFIHWRSQLAPSSRKCSWLHLLQNLLCLRIL